MTLTFPLAVSDFADRLRLTSASWMLMRQQEHSNLGSGEILAADRGPPLWEADCTTVEMHHADMRAVRARLDALDGSIQSFYLFDPAARFPREDPSGALLGIATPTLYSIGDDKKTMRIDDLPAGYSISDGDMLSLDYASPTRRLLLQVVVGAVADGSGLTPAIEVRPHLPPGLTAGASVTLVKPAAKVRIVPGSVRVNAVTAATSSIAFRARQTMAAG